MFEAVHGSAPDIAGKGIANPTALMLSRVLMLIHLGEHPAAATGCARAIERVYAEQKHLPPDVGGSASTERIHRRGDRETGLSAAFPARQRAEHCPEDAFGQRPNILEQWRTREESVFDFP